MLQTLVSSNKAIVYIHCDKYVVAVNWIRWHVNVNGDDLVLAPFLHLLLLFLFILLSLSRWLSSILHLLHIIRFTFPIRGIFRSCRLLLHHVLLLKLTYWLVASFTSIYDISIVRWSQNKKENEKKPKIFIWINAWTKNKRNPVDHISFIIRCLLFKQKQRLIIRSLH